MKPATGWPKTVTVVSTTGGGGAMLVDQISARGLAIAGCSAGAREAFRAAGIPFGHGKLVDVTLAGTNYETMKKVVSTLLADPETGLLVIAIGSSAQFNPDLAVKPIIDALQEASAGHAPIMAFPLPHAPEALAMLEAGGVPAFRTVECCAETIDLFMHPPKVGRAATQSSLPPKTIELLEAAPSGVMDEVAAGAVFSSLGARRPGQIVTGPDGALPAILPFPFPVVAKLVSPDLPHKTDAGAIRVNIADRAELDTAIADMRRSAEAYKPGYRLSGLLVQEMCLGLGEALIGITRDPLVGPVVTLAMGGVMTEIYRDTSVRPAPVSTETAWTMIDEVKGFALFKGFRGRPRGDIEALAQAISTVSTLALSDVVEEAEINPILIRSQGEGAVLLDALIRRR
jgi:acyl-CoA synthetase (NDP forming)